MERAQGSGAVALMVGAALLMVGNGLHPVDAAPSATSRLELAGEARWLIVHLVIAAGIGLAGIGLVTVAGRSGRAVARTAAGAGAAGAAMLAVVFAALDGYGMAALADRSQTAGADGQVVEAAAVALDAFDTGLVGLGTVLLMGVGMGGLAVALADRAGALRWCGRAAAVVAVAGTVTGLVLLLAGPTPTAINALLRPTAGAMTLLLLITGAGLRRAGLPAGATEVTAGHATVAAPTS